MSERRLVRIREKCDMNKVVDLKNVYYRLLAMGTVHFMEWGHGLESWIKAKEWSTGVDSWSGTLE